MKALAYKSVFASILFILHSHTVQAAQSSTTVCRNAGQTRSIEVLYPQAENQPACEVIYTKQGNSKVLWNAYNDMSYCEQKAMAFIGKQQTWGWECMLVETATDSEENTDTTVPGTVNSVPKNTYDTNNSQENTQEKSQSDTALAAEKADIEAEINKIKQQRKQAEK